MEAHSAIGKSKEKRAAWYESTKAAMSQAGWWSWRTKAKFRSEKKHPQSELLGLKKFINFPFNVGSEYSGLTGDNEDTMCVLSVGFHFSNYMWLGVLTSFHQFMRLKQIGRPGPGVILSSLPLSPNLRFDWDVHFASDMLSTKVSRTVI